MYAAQGQQKQAPVQIEKCLHILGKNNCWTCLKPVGTVYFTDAVCHYQIKFNIQHILCLVYTSKQICLGE